MVVVEKVRFKISNKNIRMYGVSKSTPLKLNQMIMKTLKNNCYIYLKISKKLKK